jgi:uncharacterized membrane protein YhaH (DUF805 family)
MTSTLSLRARGPQAAALAAAIAGLGTFALGAWTLGSYRAGAPNPGWIELILGWIAVSVTAGVISGRNRDALISWPAAIIGVTLAYQANDPSWLRAQTPIQFGLGEIAVLLLIFIAGGHALGVWAGTVGKKGLLAVAVAGSGTFAFTFFGYRSLDYNGPHSSSTTEIVAAFALLVAIGAAAGMITGRFRDATVSWAVAVIAVLVAYQTFYVLLYPGARYWGEDGFEGDLALIAPLLLVLIAGGHLLGAAAANRMLPRTEARS